MSQVSIDFPTPYTLPATPIMGTPTEDPILEGIRFSLSSGSHAAKYSCADCHAGSESTGEELSWFNPANGQRETVSTPTELCTKCHSIQIVASMSQSDSQLAHLSFACTECHNAHSTQASCTESACHAEVRSSIYAQIEQPENHPTSGDTDTHMCDGEACHSRVKEVAAEPIYHQPVHREVPCYVCHDATGMNVVRDSSQAWVTVIYLEQGSGTEVRLVVSHAIRREVICKKCHFAGNPWGLVQISADN